MKRTLGFLSISLVFSALLGCSSGSKPSGNGKAEAVQPQIAFNAMLDFSTTDLKSPVDGFLVSNKKVKTTQAIDLTVDEKIDYFFAARLSVCRISGKSAPGRKTIQIPEGTILTIESLRAREVFDRVAGGGWRWGIELNFTETFGLKELSLGCGSDVDDAGNHRTLSTFFASTDRKFLLEKPASTEVHMPVDPSTLIRDENALVVLDKKVLFHLVGKEDFSGIWRAAFRKGEPLKQLDDPFLRETRKESTVCVLDIPHPKRAEVFGVRRNNPEIYDPIGFHFTPFGPSIAERGHTSYLSSDGSIQERIYFAIANSAFQLACTLSPRIPGSADTLTRAQVRNSIGNWFELKMK